MQILLTVDKSISNDSGKHFKNTEISLPPEASLEDLFHQCRLGSVKEVYISVNQQIVTGNINLHSGDVVKVLPMMLGG